MDMRKIYNYLNMRELIFNLMNAGCDEDQINSAVKKHIEHWYKALATEVANVILKVPNAAAVWGNQVFQDFLRREMASRLPSERITMSSTTNKSSPMKTCSLQKEIVANSSKSNKKSSKNSSLNQESKIDIDFW